MSAGDTPTPAPLTLEAFAAWLGGNPEDEGMTSALTIGISEVERRCGPILPRGRSFTVHSGGGQMVLPGTRLSGQMTVTDPDGNEVTPTAVNLTAGIVTVPSRRNGAWTVTFAATNDEDRDEGREATLVEAAYVIAGQIFNARRGRSGKNRPQPGGSPTSDPGAPVGFAVPARALELMAGWRTYFA